jgi:hypothetical protein
MSTSANEPIRERCRRIGSYIPDFVSLTKTGTEQVLTPQFRLQCVIFPETLIGG